MSSTHHSTRATNEYISIGEFLDFASRWKWTILATVLVLSSFVAFHTLTTSPTFESKATLLLEEGGTGGGLLSDLATLTSAPAAEKEMAILRLRSLAEEVVRDPDQGTVRTSVFEPTPTDYIQDEQSPRLGLTSRIWSEDYAPLSALLRRVTGQGRPPHRLFATIDGTASAELPELRVSFPGPSRVRIARPGTMGFGEKDAVESDYSPGEVVEYETTRLRLTAVGDYVGQTYRVSRISERSAVEDLMARVTVRETARNSGVLILTVKDTDPHRAAETANAIVRSYIERSIEIGGRRATKTMNFLESELERVTRLLSEAEQEVVELSAKNTRGINVEASSEVAIGQISGYESEKIELRLARMALQEVSELLENGEYQAVARLSKDLPDVATLGYMATIGELSADALQLERSDAGPYKFLLQEKIATLEAEGDRIGLRLASLRDALAATESGNEEALARLAGIADSGANLDAVSGGYITEVAKLNTELIGLAPVITEKHPEYVAKAAARDGLLRRAGRHLASRIEGLEFALSAQKEVAAAWRQRIEAWPTAEKARITTAIEALRSSIGRNIASQIAGITSRLEALDETIAALEAELANLPEAQRILAESTRRRETYAQVAKVLMEGLQQAQLTRASTLPSAVLADPAVPSTHPARPSIFVNLALGALLSFLIGLGLAWLRNSLSDGVHTQAEVEEATGLPAIGTVPDFRRGRFRRTALLQGFAHVRDDPSGFEAEIFRSIRENLRFAVDPSQPLRTFAVTSATPSEGKSIMNVNLALSFASPESRVLLVDADLRKPTVASYFDIDPTKGFRDVLEGADWRDLVQPSKYEGLDVLPAGRHTNSASDLLRGARVGTVLEELMASYDRVVFDLPPVMVAADVETFAGRLDGVVLLVRGEVVPRRFVVASAGRLRRSGIRLLGTILNAVHSQRHGYSYGYGGYGRYGGYGFYGTKDADPAPQRNAG